MELLEERPEDAAEVEALLDLCFAPGRELLSSYRLRDGVPMVAHLCLMARDEGILVGTIRYWPVRVGGAGGSGGGGAPALLLGPVAVHPTRQSEGIGAVLIQESLERAHGWARAMLVGDEPYYRRFGFARLDGVTMPPPTNPDRVLGRALVPGAWEGIAGAVVKWTP